jgi:RNA polymerase sigma factor (sigma-70 family)
MNVSAALMCGSGTVPPPGGAAPPPGGTVLPRGAPATGGSTATAPPGSVSLPDSVNPPEAVGPPAGPPEAVSPAEAVGPAEAVSPQAERDDADLIALSRAQPEAFAAIFGRHATQIHRFAARRLGPGAAEDVVSEVFLAAFRRRDSYDLAYRDARPWLYGIATNVISRHRRDEARAYRTLARTGTDPVMQPADDDVLSRVAAGAQRRALAAALARLSGADRDTLFLVVWAGLTYAETARALRVPAGTVRSRMNRARRILRQALGGPGAVLIQEASSNE